MPGRKLIPFETVQRAYDVASPADVAAQSTADGISDARDEAGSDLTNSRRWLAASPVPRVWELRLTITGWSAFAAGALVVAIVALAFAAGRWWTVRDSV